jgi:hypothetical protein
MIALMKTRARCSLRVIDRMGGAHPAWFAPNSLVTAMIFGVEWFKTKTCVFV